MRKPDSGGPSFESTMGSRIKMSPVGKLQQLRLSENIARFENAVSCRSLLKDDNEIAVLKCQKFNHNVHRSLGLILRLFSKCLCLCHCLFVGQVKSPHHSDQMSQRSQVSEGALC